MIRAVSLLAVGLLLLGLAATTGAGPTDLSTVPARAAVTAIPSPLMTPSGPAPVAVPDEERLLARVRDRTVQRVEPSPPAPPTALTDEGFEVLLGTGPVVGTDGRVATWSLEIEPGIGLAMSDFAPEAMALLEQPRGWTATGQVRLQRVDSGAEIRVVLAQPSTVDTYCARAGMRTNGRFSCWVGGFAMLNLDRWMGGASTHTDLATYRSYLINHEFGHGLGFGHASCPAAGAPAPVMMQQTKTVGACAPNGWPVPDAPDARPAP